MNFRKSGRIITSYFLCIAMIITFSTIIGITAYAGGGEEEPFTTKVYIAGYGETSPSDGYTTVEKGFYWEDNTLVLDEYNSLISNEFTSGMNVYRANIFAEGNLSILIKDNCFIGFNDDSISNITAGIVVIPSSSEPGNLYIEGDRFSESRHLIVNPIVNIKSENLFMKAGGIYCAGEFNSYNATIDSICKTENVDESFGIFARKCFSLTKSSVKAESSNAIEDSSAIRAEEVDLTDGTSRVSAKAGSANYSCGINSGMSGTSIVNDVVSSIGGDGEFSFGISGFGIGIGNDNDEKGINIYAYGNTSAFNSDSIIDIGNLGFRLKMIKAGNVLYNNTIPFLLSPAEQISAFQDARNEATEVEATNIIDISTLSDSVTSKNYIATGSPVEPEFPVYEGNYKLEKDRDYTISYINNTDIGKATIVYNGMGAYNGTLKVDFNICVDFSPCLVYIKGEKHDIASTAVLEYSELPVSDKISIIDGTYKLEESDYTIEYYKDSAMSQKISEIKDSGTYYVKISGAGLYLGNINFVLKINNKPGVNVNTPTILKKQKITTAKIKAVKAKSLKKKVAKFKLKAKTDGKGKLTYKVTSTPKKMKKFIKVSKKGVVTLKKKAKKGKYKITITAAANGSYKMTTKVITIKVK